MAVEETQSRPIEPSLGAAANPDGHVHHDSRQQNGQTAPIAVPGPAIDGRKTIATLYSVESMVASNMVPGMVTLLNNAFSNSHEKYKIFPLTQKRVADSKEFILQLGDNPDTFIYTLAFADDLLHPIATVNARRWSGCATNEVTRADGTKYRSVFRRVGVVPEGMVVYDVHQMAVDPKMQRRGLAIHLMNIMEQEVLRRFLADRKAGLHSDTDQLWVYLETIKESNNRFYEGRGYVVDKEDPVEQGYMDSRTPFTMQFLSKRLKTVG